jgi:hypothetical protein
MDCEHNNGIYNCPFLSSVFYLLFSNTCTFQKNRTYIIIHCVFLPLLLKLSPIYKVSSAKASKISLYPISKKSFSWKELEIQYSGFKFWKQESIRLYPHRCKACILLRRKIENSAEVRGGSRTWRTLCIMHILNCKYEKKYEGKSYVFTRPCHKSK